MDRRSFLETLGAGALSLAFPSCASPSAGKGRRRPNVILFLVDDLGWRDLACTGSTFYETPNIDRLAREGMRFTNAYASCPVCSPTRASIMTGKYPPRVGITDWIPGNRPRNRKLLGPPIAHHLALKEVTIAEALEAAGYTTFFAGKWHLGGKGYYPEDQGFGTNIGGCEWGHPHGGYYSPYKNPHMKDGPKGEYLTDRLTKESLRFLEKVGDKPFFLDLSFYAVHAPIQGCKRFVPHFREKAAALPPLKGPAQVPEHEGHTKTRQDNPKYASMIKAVDEGVGKILAKLKALGLEKNTVVIFTSDNGGLSTLRRRGFPTSNFPLRAGKGWAYEGGIRIPLIIKAPGVTRPGSLSKEPVISMDLYPTILSLLGLPLRPEQHKDGLDLAPILSGRKKRLPRKALFWHYPHYHGSTWTPGAAVRAGRWKYIEFYDWGTQELYDLETDEGERHDLSAKFPRKKKELQALLHAWQKSVGAEMPRPNPDYHPRKKLPSPKTPGK